MTPRRLALVAALACALSGALGGGLVACSKGPQAVAEPDAGQVVDVELMAYLSEARALHHQANLKEELGDLKGAIAAMDRLTTARRPAGGRIAEVDEVLADAYARRAELELKIGDLAAADRSLRSGLEHAPDTSYFRGHLVEVQGLVEEARGAQLADAGKAAEAKQARERAITLLEEAIRIQEAVVARATGARDGGAEGGR
ncbi:MAG: hypothetical protein JNL38_30320 [Myxococcales bacterium]|jgi:tetratricopeptide (TPR) repeat protein|nr:hypothetical protein [Myxococcales bacterium]